MKTAVAAPDPDPGPDRDQRMALLLSIRRLQRQVSDVIEKAINTRHPIDGVCGDGWAEGIIKTANGTYVEIRCPHYIDPLRYIVLRRPPTDEPVFRINASDALAPDAIRAYRSLALRYGLHEHAYEVDKALAEVRDWQVNHRTEVHMPNHTHVPWKPSTKAGHPGNLSGQETLPPCPISHHGDPAGCDESCYLNVPGGLPPAVKAAGARARLESGGGDMEDYAAYRAAEPVPIAENPDRLFTQVIPGSDSWVDLAPKCTLAEWCALPAGHDAWTCSREANPTMWYPMHSHGDGTPAHLHSSANVTPGQTHEHVPAFAILDDAKAYTIPPPRPDWRTAPNAFPTPALTDEQNRLLTAYGYPTELPPRGVTGPPNEVTTVYAPNGKAGPPYGFLRNHVCMIEGVLIDGHEPSDLDLNGPCIHCGRDLTDDGPEDDDDRTVFDNRRS